MPFSAPLTRIIECPRELRADALRTLHDALPLDQRSVLAQVLDQLDPVDEAAWTGLLIAMGNGAPGEFAAMDGVIWVQRAPGNTAVIWAAAEEGEVSSALLCAAAEFVDAYGIPLAQLVVGERDGYSETQLERCGFPKFTALLYLFAEVSQLPDANDEVSARPAAVQQRGDLQFVSRAGGEPQRLGNVLERTYVGTLDCPGLDGIRSMDEVLEGYRNQGCHSPDDWYFVQKKGGDVGVLILAAHPGFGNWELVYMGVFPEVRGQKYGEAMIQFALDATARHGAERLVLAVDEGNVPALRAYERAGFVTWDRRVVYARLRKGGATLGNR